MIESCAAIVIAAKHHELIKVKDTRGTTYTVGALRCKFEFRTPDWDHSAKTAMFCKGDAILHPEVAENAIAVPLDEDNECAVPCEVLKDALPYSIGVWGALEGGLRIVSRWLVFNAQPGCYSAPADPEPTIYEQILMTAQNAVDTANSVVDRANSGEFDGISIVKSEINNNGELELTYSDGQDVTLGKVVGADGLTPFVGSNGNWWIGTTDTGVKATGADGKDGAPGKDGERGEQGIQGEQGVQGEPGEKGQDGTSVTVTSVTESAEDAGANVVTFSDGNTLNIKNGNKGATGADGKDGISATHAWEGTVLTVTSASGTSSVDLKGEKGDTYAITEADYDAIATRVLNDYMEQAEDMSV